MSAPVGGEAWPPNHEDSWCHLRSLLGPAVRRPVGQPGLRGRSARAQPPRVHRSRTDSPLRRLDPRAGSATPDPQPPRRQHPDHGDVGARDDGARGGDQAHRDVPNMRSTVCRFPVTARGWIASGTAAQALARRRDTAFQTRPKYAPITRHSSARSSRRRRPAAGGQ
jgi:hypothetical protein